MAGYNSLLIFDWRSWSRFLAKQGKAFSKFVIGSILKKWFSSYLEVRNKCSEPWKIVFFTFFSTNVWIPSWPKEMFEKMVFKLPLGEKQMFWTFLNCIFLSFANYWVAKLKLFPGKARKSLQNNLNQSSKLVIGRV